MIHKGINYTIETGDCICVMHRLKNEGKKFPLAIFSPPFANLLAYLSELKTEYYAKMVELNGW